MNVTLALGYIVKIGTFITKLEKLLKHTDRQTHQYHDSAWPRGIKSYLHLKKKIIPTNRLGLILCVVSVLTFTVQNSRMRGINHYKAIFIINP